MILISAESERAPRPGRTFEFGLLPVRSLGNRPTSYFPAEQLGLSSELLHLSGFRGFRYRGPDPRDYP